jgi:PPM family protein phosphatase
LSAYDVAVATADLLGTMSRAVHQANHVLACKVRESPRLAGMGTTLTAMLWSSGHFALAHIGDSRGYRLRDGALRQITEDHSLAMLVADPGRLAELIARYLDGRPDRSPDLTLREARTGDRYLLCSDGLSGVVSPAAVKTTLQAAATCDEAVRRLTELTYEAGAPDNVSVLVLDVTDQATRARGREPLVLGAAAATGAQPVPA